MGSISIDAHAAPVDLSTWLAPGDTQVNAIAAKVTTAFTNELPLGTGALDINALKSQLNTPSGTLGVNANEGSALSQTFNFAASTSLSFNWTLATDIFDVKTLKHRETARSRPLRHIRMAQSLKKSVQHQHSFVEVFRPTLA